jgi:hypothetical protein
MVVRNFPGSKQRPQQLLPEAFLLEISKTQSVNRSARLSGARASILHGCGKPDGPATRASLRLQMKYDKVPLGADRKPAPGCSSHGSPVSVP